jgi:hypothetical protein
MSTRLRQQKVTKRIPDNRTYSNSTGLVVFGAADAPTLAKESTCLDNSNTWNTFQRLKRDRNIDPSVLERISRLDHGSTIFRVQSRGKTSNLTWGETVPNYESRNGFYRFTRQNGTEYLNFIGASMPGKIDLDLDVLRAFGGGSQAIKRYAPNVSQADSGTLLGETLLGGLPRVPGANVLHQFKSGDPKVHHWASEYLNWHFGVAPTIGDVKNIVRSVKSSQQIIEQMLRDSGRQVRRRGIIDSYVNSSVTSRQMFLGNAPYTASISQNIATFGPVTTSETIDRWFLGTFRYTFGSPAKDFLSRSRRYIREADLLYGLSLKPSTVWELTRFSWLVDWFVDIGSVIRSVELLTKDGLVMEHGHTMVHHRIEHSGSNVLKMAFRPAYGLESKFYAENKVRVPASPFGFDVGLDGLNAFQSSILIALGINQGCNLPPWVRARL